MIFGVGDFGQVFSLSSSSASSLSFLPSSFSLLFAHWRNPGQYVRNTACIFSLDVDKVPWVAVRAGPLVPSSSPSLVLPPSSVSLFLVFLLCPPLPIPPPLFEAEKGSPISVPSSLCFLYSSLCRKQGLGRLCAVGNWCSPVQSPFCLHPPRFPLLFILVQPQSRYRWHNVRCFVCWIH